MNEQMCRHKKRKVEWLEKFLNYENVTNWDVITDVQKELIYISYFMHISSSIHLI